MPRWAWPALLCLVFALPTAAAWSLSAPADAPAASCESACPCEAAAAHSVADHAEQGHPEDPDEEPGTECPPGCALCPCCPAAVANSAPDHAPAQLTCLGRQDGPAPPDRRASGVSRRIYRPPKPSLV